MRLISDEAEIVKELRELERSGSLNIDKYKSKKLSNGLDNLDSDFKFESNNKCYFDKSFGFQDLNDKLYQKLVENSLEGILIIDVDGKILFSNPAVNNIFGFKNIEKIIGLNFLDLIHIDYRDKIIRDHKILSNEREGLLNTYKAVYSNGENIWIEGLSCKICFLKKEAIAVFVRDITHRQKTWSELVKLGDKYKALADMSTDGIIIIDQLGRINYANDSFADLCDKNKSQLNGILFRDFLSEKSIYQFQEIFITARKTGKIIKDIELEFIKNKDEIIPIELSISRLKNSNDEFTGFACTIHDITIHKKIENELKKSKKLKTDFMNIAAHELKSPITPIKGYLDLIISDKEINENAKKWGKISLRNTERLLNLVNDILDVSRLDNDTMIFNMEKINPIDIIVDVSDDIKPVLKKKNVSLVKKIPIETIHILGDKRRFEQVIKNILGNAAKFTDEGKIIVEARKIDNNLLIIIEDTGIGIRNDELKKVFSKFYQAYSGHDRIYEGTGLGLFICKEIINRHNGRIWAESKIGIGSKFFIEIKII